MIINIERRESADGYSAVVAHLNARWRVIACRDGIQWILQNLTSATGRATQASWRGRSYCRTREALIRVCREYAAPLDPSVVAVLESLPARIEGGCP